MILKKRIGNDVEIFCNMDDLTEFTASMETVETVRETVKANAVSVGW